MNISVELMKSTFLITFYIPFKTLENQQVNTNLHRWMALLDSDPSSSWLTSLRLDHKDATPQPVFLRTCQYIQGVPEQGRM